MRVRSIAVAGYVAAVLIAAHPHAAEAIPAFARKYGVSCSMCHSTVPRLNAFGEQFAANGFEMAVRELARDTMDTGDSMLRLLRRIDFAVRMDLFATASVPMRADAADFDLQTPYTMKLLSGGVLADGISYYMYFLLSERGEVGGLEDAYVQFTDVGGSGINAIVGQFQVSDPLFKRELRLQYEDYQPYRVRVGDARADLAYDRGIMLGYSPWENGDVALMLVNGQGLDPAGDDRQYDRDNAKSLGVRYSQGLGPVRVGAFGYFGRERAVGETDRITIWVTIVWNDPVNLMSYVSFVFRSYFGFDREEAERRMLLVHHEGRAVVASGPREAMERHVEAMHEFGLWATVAKQ